MRSCEHRALALMTMALLVGAMCTGVSRADTLRFKSGERVRGVIIKETASYVRIRLHGSGVTIQYSKGEIAQIEPDERPGAKAQRLIQTGRFGDAIAILQNAAKHSSSGPAQEMAWFGLSRVYLAQGRYKEAALSFVWLVRTNPATRLYAYLPLPSGREAEGEQALAALREAATDVRETPFVRQVAKLLVAAVHISLGRFVDAEEGFAPTVRAADGRVAELATLVQAYSLERQGKIDQATVVLQDALWQQRIAMRPVLSYRLGAMAYQLRQWKRAIVWLLRVKMMYDSPPVMRADAMLLAGRCFESLGRPKDALEMYDELSENCGQLTQAQQARVRIAALRGGRKPAVNSDQ